MIRRVAPDRMADFVAEARIDGAPDFEIRQFQPHTGERFVIQYIEPIEANREAVGFDVASEPRRRQAAEEAMRTGTATLTAPVTLVQARAESERAFLLLLPVYRQGLTPATEAARLESAVGWTYATMLIDEVLHDLVPGRAVSVALRDGSLKDAPPFFTLNAQTELRPDAFQRHVPIPIYGRSWEAQIRATPSFVRDLHLPDPGLTGLWGAASSF